MIRTYYSAEEYKKRKHLSIGTIYSYMSPSVNSLHRNNFKIPAVVLIRKRAALLPYFNCAVLIDRNGVHQKEYYCQIRFEAYDEACFSKEFRIII